MKINQAFNRLQPLCSQHFSHQSIQTTHSSICSRSVDIALPAPSLYCYTKTAHIEELFSKVNKSHQDILQWSHTWNHSDINDYLKAQFNFHSNAIKGNTLSLGEVVQFMQTGLTVEGKLLNDHLDIQYHDKAVETLFEFQSLQRALEPSIIQELHQLCFPPDPERPDLIPGQYKKRNNMALLKNDPKTGCPRVQEFVLPEDCQEEVEELMAWVQDNEKKLHAMELAAVAHYNLLRIHPFPDGNGRVARLFANLVVLRKGYNLMVIDVADRDEYTQSLAVADDEDLAPLVAFTAKSMIKTQERLMKLKSVVQSSIQTKLGSK